MNMTTETHTPNTFRSPLARKTMLKTLRNRVRGNIVEDGIWLVYRSRYEDSARSVADLAKALGGDAEVKKFGKTVIKDFEATKTWRVVFTVSCPVDSYLAGRMNMRDMLKWEEQKAQNLPS